MAVYRWSLVVSCSVPINRVESQTGNVHQLVRIQLEGWSRVRVPIQVRILARLSASGGSGIHI